MFGPVLPPSDTGICGARPLRQQMAGVSLFCRRYPVPALDTLGSLERCPSGRRSATGNRVSVERRFAGSNPALSAGCVPRAVPKTAQNLGSTEEESLRRLFFVSK